MKISLVVATSNNNAIGKDNQLLWHLPNDLKMFKKLTSRKVVIMGRKTYESIGKALPNRLNIVISANKKFCASDCLISDSLEHAIDLVKSIEGLDETFIIGGGTIYKQALEIDIIDEVYLTKVNVDIDDADTFFEWDNTDWRIVSSENNVSDNIHFTDYQFLKYKKKLIL